MLTAEQRATAVAYHPGPHLETVVVKVQDDDRVGFGLDASIFTGGSGTPNACAVFNQD